MTSEPSCRRFRSISDDNAGDDRLAEPLTPWPGAGTFAPTLRLQRIRAPVLTLFTVVTVGPVTLIEPNIFPEPHPAAKPTATSARARIGFTVSFYTPPARWMSNARSGVVPEHWPRSSDTAEVC
jgi:hypothetical protein